MVHTANYKRGEPGKLQSGLMVLAGPVLGLAYVIALPFIAIGTLVAVVGRKAGGWLIALVSNLVSFGWRPSEAHLAGKKKEKGKEESPEE